MLNTCRYFAIKHGSAIFYKHGVTGQPRQWVEDEALFRRWRDGRTGMPLVDANMREMKATGEALHKRIILPMPKC